MNFSVKDIPIDPPPRGWIVFLMFWNISDKDVKKTQDIKREEKFVVSVLFWSYLHKVNNILIPVRVHNFDLKDMGGGSLEFLINFK